MTTEQIESIMPQLDEAMRFASQASKTIYVFEDAQVGQWCLSGRLPRDAEGGFYVVYPNGETDQLGPVPLVGAEDWNFYWAHCNTSLPGERAAARLKGVAGERQRHALLGYLAFAPFIQFVLFLMAFGGSGAFWTTVPYVVAAAIPATLWFVVMTWNGQNQKATALSCSIIVNAHMLFLWIVSGLSAFEVRLGGMPDVPTEICLGGMVGCMALSGLAALLSFDSRPRTIAT